MTTPGTEEKATVREVYKLVSEVETRLADKIEDVRDEVGGKVDRLTQSVDEIKDGLLPRVSVLEEQRRADRSILDDHEIRLLKVETSHQRALGHLGAWKIVGGIFGGAATIVIADIIFKALGG